MLRTPSAQSGLVVAGHESPEVGGDDSIGGAYSNDFARKAILAGQLVGAGSAEAESAGGGLERGCDGEGGEFLMGHGFHAQASGRFVRRGK